MFHTLLRRYRQARVPGLLLGLCATLAACGLTQPPPQDKHGAAAPSAAATAPPPTPPVRPVEVEPQAPATQMQPAQPGPLNAVLAHADRIRALPTAELTAEIARLNDTAAALGPNPTLQMQQAIALAQTRNPADLARALALMQRVVNDPSPEARPLQPLARLLAARYQEQRRVEDERDRQGPQLRDAQKRIEQLNDRLEAVRAIERSFGRPARPTP